MKERNIFVLEEGLDLLKLIDDATYARCARRLDIKHRKPYQALSGFYDCFLRGFKTGKVDYDSRDGNEIIERDRNSAISAFESIIGQFRALPLTNELASVQVKMEGVDKKDAWSYTSLRRELQFLLSHTAHHYALIAMLLRIYGVEPSYDFGVAPSTLEHRRLKAA